MKTIIMIMILFCFAGCASHPFEGWTRNDTLRQASIAALQIVDCGQTMAIADHPDKYKEVGIIASQIIGEHPSKESVYIYFGSAIILNTVFSAMLDPKVRKWYQGVEIVWMGKTIYNNDAIGVRIEF